MPKKKQQHPCRVTPGLGLGLVALLLAGVVHADAFKIETATTRLVDSQVALDARIAYHFSETALEALESGVPLVLEVQVEIERDEAWPWDKEVVDARLRYRFRHHALAGAYQVEELSTGTLQSFATRDAAIRTLGMLEALPLIEQAALEKGERYTVRIRAFLDIEALPLPLRPLAYISPSWRLSSEWLSWSLRP